MKKHAKIVLVLILTLVIFATSIPVSASDESTGIAPRLSHMGGGAFSFVANEEGGHVDISYEGYSTSFVKATVTVTIQKRFLLMFWREVDEWTETSTERLGYFSRVSPLDGSGTYRATMILTVLGTDGTCDVIEDTIECSY